MQIRIKVYDKTTSTYLFFQRVSVCLMVSLSRWIVQLFLRSCVEVVCLVTTDGDIAITTYQILNSICWKMSQKSQLIITIKQDCLFDKNNFISHRVFLMCMSQLLDNHSLLIVCFHSPLR